MVKITRFTPLYPASEKKFHDVTGPSTVVPLRIRSARESARVWWWDIVKFRHSSGLLFNNSCMLYQLPHAPATRGGGGGSLMRRKIMKSFVKITLTCKLEFSFNICKHATTPRLAQATPRVGHWTPQELPSPGLLRLLRETTHHSDGSRLRAGAVFISASRIRS